nr:MAG TPA: Chromatin remodeling complex ATPase [Caudoviricetes sp.]
MVNNDWSRLKEGAYLSPNKRMLVLKVREALRFKNSFPPSHFCSAPFRDMHLVGIPYEMESLQLLRNLNCNTRGIEILRHAYKLPLVEQQFPLLPHQVSTAAFLSENRRAYCTSTMRTGKTASAIVAAKFLQERRMATGCLCIATKTNLRGVWEKEIRGMYPDATIVVVHHKDPRKRRQLLEQDAHFYIVNYDGVKIVKNELIDAVERGRISIAIGDELTHYANSRNQLWDAADQVINGTRWEVTPGRTFVDGSGKTVKLKDRRRRAPQGRPIEYAWGLTGTPGDPEMVYGQVKLITPQNMNMSFTAWRDQTMIQFGFNWVPREGYKDKIYQVMQPCIRFDKNDIMDLPPVTNRGADADLSAEQIKLYKKIRTDMVALAASGEEIKAPTKAALTFKLLQIAQGVVKAEGESVLELDVKSRIDTLVELIETASQKVVIFCAFTAVIDLVERQLKERGYTVGVVDGRVTGTKRDETFRKFQEEKDPHVILCHPKTTAFGVELAAADTMIFYGPPLSGEFVYQQAVERMSSLKQKASSIQIIQLSACAEERKLFRSIKMGVSINEAINDMFTVDPNDV